MMTYQEVSMKYQEYRLKHHTSSLELDELAKKTKPPRLILYERVNTVGEDRPNLEYYWRSSTHTRERPKQGMT